MKLNYKTGKGDKIHIYIDGEYAMTADLAFIAQENLKQNQELTEQEFDRLKKAVELRRAYNKAVTILSYRAHSKQELITKLKQKGYGEAAQEAVDMLEGQGLIDERGFAESYALELKRTKGYGKRRIMQELYRKGIDSQTAQEVTQDFEDDSDEIAGILQRKYGNCLSEQKGVTRAINGLLRMGYSISQIRAAIETVQSSLGENLDTE